jgi:small subunit ribosomal protein S21
MLIIEIKNGENIERALKTLKSKVIKTKQNQKLLARKEYVKPSVANRTQLLKAIYTERKRIS